MFRHLWSDVTTARFRLSKCKGYLHTQKELLFVGIYFYSELFVQIWRYLRLGHTQAQIKKTQTSLVCFFLFPLLHIWEMALWTCALLNAQILDPQELGSLNVCLNLLMALTSLCPYPARLTPHCSYVYSPLCSLRVKSNLFFFSLFFSFFKGWFQLQTKPLS